MFDSSEEFCRGEWPLLCAGSAAWLHVWNVFNPLYHHDEHHSAFIPAAYPANAPAIDVIAKLDRPEKPKELRFDMHA